MTSALVLLDRSVMPWPLAIDLISSIFILPSAARRSARADATFCFVAAEAVEEVTVGGTAATAGANACAVCGVTVAEVALAATAACVAFALEAAAGFAALVTLSAVVFLVFSAVLEVLVAVQPGGGPMRLADASAAAGALSFRLYLRRTMGISREKVWVFDYCATMIAASTVTPTASGAAIRSLMYLQGIWLT